MTADTTELEAQTGMALAALGVAFARTLLQRAEPTEVLGTLKLECQRSYQHLQNTGQDKAVLMFATFARALHDKEWFPPEA